MPPNRKAHFEIARNVTSLKIAHHTAPALKARPDEATTPPPPQQPQPIDSASYWEWPADTAAEAPTNQPAQQTNSKVVEDDLDDVFSANHIVANLVQAAAQLAANQQLKQQPQQEAAAAAVSTHHQENEDYWFQPFKHRHAVDVVDNTFTSAHRVEANLIQASEGAALRQHNDRVDDDDDDEDGDDTTMNPESVAYWNWPAWKEKDDSEALFSADHVEAGLVRQAAEQRLQPTLTTSSEPSSDYWAF